MRAFTEALDIIRDDPAENAAMLRRTTSTSQNAIEFKNGSVLWFTPEEVLPRLRCPMIDEGLYDVAAGAPGHVHLALVSVVAVGALPHQLAVVLCVIEGVTDRNYITNSYHVHVSEPIDAFDKLAIEAQFQACYLYTTW